MMRQNNTQFSGERKRVYRDQVRQAGAGGCWLWDGGKMEAEMRMNHALACAAHFLPGAAVVFIIFRPNPIHSGEGVIYCLPQTLLAQKSGDTPRSKNVNTLKASPTPSSPPLPPFGGCSGGDLKGGSPACETGLGVFSHYLAPSQTLLALFFSPTPFPLRCISFNNVHRALPSSPLSPLSLSLHPCLRGDPSSFSLDPTLHRGRLSPPLLFLFLPHSLSFIGHITQANVPSSIGLPLILPAERRLLPPLLPACLVLPFLPPAGPTERNSTAKKKYKALQSSN